ncbi:sulfatase-like hydrolase/transferase [Halopiger xanaduensis]|uniref:Sulfatase n=1 Tax=Halopiger xanaduensis (strain DSM 18323 / JCM 14033 / SH-6) TaxID=797210 RepID=F8DA52_HALXS|nr:sulfatase-like hydrolase/transferase [Halopiger xanaduensis]AEH36978.1 sulfatase [Halopiger xanaduensis SH-6]
MNLKRALIETLPPWAKRLLAAPYDRYQTRKADAAFAEKALPELDPADDAPDHIVCIVVDALRADYVDDETTPYLASLNGTDAVTPGAWTFPAVSSLLTGIYPHEHGAMKQTDEFDNSDGLSLPPRMDEDRVTLTEILAGAGYDTYGGFGHDTPFVAVSGRFHDHALYHKMNSDADDVLEDYLEWVSDRTRTFAFLHLADPHIPVDPPSEYWKKHDIDTSIDDLENWRYRTDTDCSEDCQSYREHRRRLYRASVDYVDDALSRFETGLENALDDPLLIVTADHGEALWEQVEFDVEHFNGTGCVDHGGAPYEALARVPLLTNADWTFDSDVSLIDIAPTITDSVGVSGPEMTGHSLRGEIPENRQLLVEGSLSGYEKKAVYDGAYKLIVSRGDDVEVGYEVSEEELVDVPADRRNTMIDALPAWPDGTNVQTEVSGMVEDRLEQLGYR